MSQQMASNSTQQPTITSLTDGSVTAQAENSVVPPIGDQPPNEAMTTRKRKAPTKTSKAWKDFTEVIVGGIKKGKCSHCFTELAVTRGSTSSLLRHRLTCIPRKASISERNASSVASGSGVGASKVKTKSRNEFDTWARQLDMVQPNKSELDIYLEESIYLPGEEDADFDALTWWKANTLKFRHLSKLARDILSIPVTTVASESAFSAGGRVLDQYRSSLKADAVEALLCGGDWLRGDSGIEELFNVEEENNDD